MQLSEVEETLNRIKTHKGVSGIVIVNHEGVPIRSTLEQKYTLQYSALISQLTQKAKSMIRDLDPQNDLTFLRLRSRKHEIMVAPDKDYILIVIQDPNADIMIQQQNHND
ncbi:roadblock, putative [Perkinsus marinus ATCC 50983]|uniref:Dynein light chain roadblock n=1 Tax=Perkinsus marinus (strain ATCC 50983 / TXsc) TaxID=423536 RepID=C5KVR1_PERM5|nr:roadblock, putative [Perkinsus marinus ATCC 50983]EER11446.1 roadblock, putative [Perkinsus marinus ATCC 50983]|eukprot:XP_002779651.1 roadblock, putative [Perkinsus marinus ATCC 50983]